MRTFVLLALALLVTPAPPQTSQPFGVALALHPIESHRQGFHYPPDPAPLLGLHAQQILLSPSWVWDGARLRPGPVRDSTLRRVVRRAHELGLGVALAPWIAIDNAGPGQWRGNLAPAPAFGPAYRRFITHYAAIAAEERVALFSVGSELSSLGRDPAWSSIIEEVRTIYPGPLAFVANHDALDRAPFDDVDVLGVSAYFPLTSDPNASPEEMARAWERIASTLRALKARHDKPLVIFEVGYPSRDGGAVQPWNNTTGTPADVDEQHRAYVALDAALRNADWLDGLFVWNWFGPGGPYDRHYTVRGKPAEDVVRRFLRARMIGSAAQREARR